jgi:hypothetical protein
MTSDPDTRESRMRRQLIKDGKYPAHLLDLFIKHNKHVLFNRPTEAGKSVHITTPISLDRNVSADVYQVLGPNQCQSDPGNCYEQV